MLTTFREKMETECTRRTCQIEAQVQADCQKVTGRCASALQSLERHLRQELRELLEQQREERSQWQFEKDELTQECAEAQEQLKETLQREKATSLALTQQREMLEKTYKEHLDSMVGEREQLLKDLEDLRNVSESQQSLLSNQILELKRSHERELKDRERVLCQAGISEQLASQRLESLEMERDRERQEMMSKLLAMESVHRETCEKADRDRAEMSTEVARLQNKIKEMQQVASPPSRLQNGCPETGGEEAEGSGAMSLLQQGEQLLEENGDVLLSLQRAHERAVKENVRMAAEISRLQQRLQKLEPGSVMSSCLEEATSGLFGNSVEQSCLPQNRRKQVGGVTRQRVLSDLQGDEARDLGSTGTSSVQRREGRVQESDASMGSFSELENSDETRTETWDLKNQVSQLQEQLMTLRADCDRASEKKQDLLFDVSVLKKKLHVLEAIAEASPRYKLLYEDAGRENDCLQEELRALETHYEEALEHNKELASEVFRLQDELKRAEDVAETFLGLEKSYNEVRRENEELHVVVLRLEGTIERLQESAALPCDCFSLWEAQLEELEPEPEPDGKALALRQTPGTRVSKALSVCQVIEERYQENQYLEQEDTQVLGKVKAHEIAWLHRTIQTHGEKPGEQDQVIIEENTTLLGLQHRHFQRQAVIAELELEKKKLQELTRQLRERVTNLVKQKDVPAQGGKEEELKAMMHDLQVTCSEMQQKVELLR